jgi:hypothetical protein
MAQKAFSSQLDEWVRSKSPKTFGHLSEVFGKSSFATIFIICMALPATPIPTGGITHVLEAGVMIVALETILGLKTLWLPKWLSRRTLPAVVIKKGLPKFIGYLRWLESHSRVRGEKFMNHPMTERFAGLAVLAFTIGAFFAVPFSNLDTLVSVGAVVLSLGLVLNDVAYFIAGLLIGIVGLILEITVGAVVAKFMHRLWEQVGLGTRLAALAVLVLLVLWLIIRHKK